MLFTTTEPRQVFQITWHARSGSYSNNGQTGYKHFKDMNRRKASCSPELSGLIKIQINLNQINWNELDLCIYL